MRVVAGSRWDGMRKPWANLDTFAGSHHASPGRLGQPGVTKKTSQAKGLRSHDEGPWKIFFLRVNPALLDGVRHPIDREHVRCDAVVYVMRIRVTHDIIEGRHHDFLELLVDQ